MRSRRSAGFSLIELLASVGGIATAALLAGSLTFSIRSTNDLAASYAEDVRGVRRALRTIEEDLRGAYDAVPGTSTLRVLASPDLPRYRMEADVLYRAAGGREAALAHGIADFRAECDGDLVRVTLELAPRARPDRAGPRVGTTVRMRNGGSR